MSSEYARMIRQPSAAPLPADHWTTVTQLPYFHYMLREDAEQMLTNTENYYILRICNDPSEWINDRPNPDVFVISYTWRTDNVQPGEAEVRIMHSKIRRRPNCGFYFGDRRDTDAGSFYPTVTELLHSTVLSGLQPLLR
jgi:hypothetical protein